MGKRTNSFPVYVSGQYLSNEHLNDTQDFLWSEELATRYAAIGNGIVSGLSTNISGSALVQSIILDAGAALTIDGYLLQANENWTFTKAAPAVLVWVNFENKSQSMLMPQTEYDKVKDQLDKHKGTTIQGMELLTAATASDSLPAKTENISDLKLNAGQLLSQDILVSWIEILDVQFNYCLQGSCNSKGVKRHYTPHFYSIPKKALDISNKFSDSLPYSRVARLKNLSKVGSLVGLNSACFEAWKLCLAELLPYFVKGNSTKHLSQMANVLGTDEITKIDSLAVKLEKITKTPTATSCPQYYISFASDLSEALNELIGHYNSIATHHKSMEANRMERCIIIGDYSNDERDQWRYYFTSHLNKRYLSDVHILRTMFRRIAAMITGFMDLKTLMDRQKLVKGPLAIPSAVQATLGYKAIPYYYDTVNDSGELLNHWNEKGGEPRNIFCYYDSLLTGRSGNPNMKVLMSTTDWNKTDFYRIEGHVGLTLSTARAILNAWIADEGAPIQLLDCDISYKGATTWLDWHQRFKDIIENGLKTLKKVPEYKTYDFKPLKNIQSMITQTSYRQVNDVQAVFNNFTAYNGVFNATQKEVKGKSKAAGNSPITSQVIAAYQKVFPKETMLALHKEYLIAVEDLKQTDVKKEIVLKDLVGLEYLGGVPKGGTLVLLHNKGTICGDGCLPYFFRINSGRVIA